MRGWGRPRWKPSKVVTLSTFFIGTFPLVYILSFPSPQPAQPLTCQQTNLVIRKITIKCILQSIFMFIYRETWRSTLGGRCESISKNAVCRKAPSTLGLLTMQSCWVSKFQPQPRLARHPAVNLTTILTVVCGPAFYILPFLSQLHTPYLISGWNWFHSRKAYIVQSSIPLEKRKQFFVFSRVIGENLVALHLPVQPSSMQDIVVQYSVELSFAIQ